MKKSLLILYIIALSLTTNGQAKLLSSSTHYYDTLTSTFYTHDSMKNFFKPANTATSTQFHDDGYVDQLADSVWQYGYTGTTLIRQARWYNTFNPTYTAKLLYIDTINDANGNNVYSFKTEYFHNGTNYDSSITWQTVFSPFSTTLNGRDYYHQNGQNLIDTFWSIYFTAGAYSSSYKQVSLYNANNDLSMVYSYQSADSINYTPTSRYEYFYSPSNLLDSMVFYAYNGGTWYKTGVRIYTYNASNARIKMELININALTQVYTNSARDEYVRVNGTHLDSLYSELWNAGLNKYDTTVKRGYLVQSGLIRKVYSYNYDVLGSKWIFDPYGALRNYYYDVELSTANQTKASTAISLFPNPTQHTLHINPPQPGARYSILSTDGKLISQGFVQDNNKIETGSLSTGAYILLLDIDNSTLSQTFIKRD